MTALNPAYFAETADPNTAANAESNVIFANLLDIVSSTSETGEPINSNAVALGRSETLEPGSLWYFD